ncbi:putative uncharacterized protein (plasmid) [Aliivibrio wodanis]|uniref:Uncharacterized protein n=1 Tax=Aliivibrio wodanis TaxID=80852 RepID=A0A090K2M9_9GAMM|nr:putative uncharacterized protein [Aliivibrio wodanis]
MDKQLIEKVHELWDLCGPIDCSESVENLEKEIIKFFDMIEPCRNWLSKRNKLKNIKRTPDSYTLKHEVEFSVKKWVPHSVFIFSAYLEGFNLSRSSLRSDIYVVATNIGAEKSNKYKQA